MLSWNNASAPRANSHPHPIEKAISNMFRKEWNEKKSKARIRTTARLTARIESCFICWALPTAICGPPNT